jgi:hypothetical protein
MIDIAVNIVLPSMLEGKDIRVLQHFLDYLADALDVDRNNDGALRSSITISSIGNCSSLLFESEEEADAPFDSEL